jgi:hypothetical protein
MRLSACERSARAEDGSPALCEPVEAAISRNPNQPDPVGLGQERPPKTCAARRAGVRARLFDVPGIVRLLEESGSKEAT